MLLRGMWTVSCSELIAPQRLCSELAMVDEMMMLPIDASCIASATSSIAS